MKILKFEKPITYSTADEAHRKLGIHNLTRSMASSDDGRREDTGASSLRADAAEIDGRIRGDGGRRRRRRLRRRGIEEDVLADVMAVAPVRRVADGYSVSC